jgi:DNA-directed RNA polymerase specialized sigma24 family protein
MIANRLATKPNFVNYSYKEDMVSDGIENCICYIDNFDPLKSTNPFAYFTQIIYYAFLRRILKEKKQLYIKHKSLENSMLLNELMEQSEFDEKDFTPSYIDLDNENMFDFIKTFEDNLLSKKKKRKKGIETFLEEEILDDKGNIEVPNINPKK